MKSNTMIRVMALAITVGVLTAPAAMAAEKPPMQILFTT